MCVTEYARMHLHMDTSTSIELNEQGLRFNRFSLREM